MLRHVAFQAICTVKPVILFHTYVGNDNVKLEMVRGSRHVLIGYFPTKIRALLIATLLGWDEAWQPRVTRNTTD